MNKKPFSIANLRDTGEALYGPRWQSELGRNLKSPGTGAPVAPRSIARWLDGTYTVPDLREQLAALCRQRAEEVPSLAGGFKAIAKSLEAMGPPERLRNRPTAT